MTINASESVDLRAAITRLGRAIGELPYSGDAHLRHMTPAFDASPREQLDYLTAVIMDLAEDLTVHAATAEANENRLRDYDRTIAGLKRMFDGPVKVVKIDGTVVDKVTQ